MKKCIVLTMLQIQPRLIWTEGHFTQTYFRWGENSGSVASVDDTNAMHRSLQM